MQDQIAKTLATRVRRDFNYEEIRSDEHEQVPDEDENGELNGAQLRNAKRTSAVCPRAAIRIGDVIEPICSRDHLRMPDLPAKWMPLPPSLQRAGKFSNGFIPQNFILLYL